VFWLAGFLTLLPAAWGAEPAATPDAVFAREEPFVTRQFTPTLDGQWIGEAISYGPYRAGQAPGKELPTVEQLTEDLQILSQHWHLLRMYGSAEVSEDVLEIIHDKKIPMRVMLGAWLFPEHPTELFDAAKVEEFKVANRREVAEVIRLANKFPEEVIAVNVGNETQVTWSGHRVNVDVLIPYLREVRAKTKEPVATADDFNFWNKPESPAVAAEVDFIVTHIYAMWGGVSFEQSMPWTRRMWDDVCKNHPEKTIVIGEIGWATLIDVEGGQGERIKGKAGEEEQRLFHQQLMEWTRENKICTFFFEAFDEPWKGGNRPDEVEKHWGLFYETRQPKPAMQDK
jgi:exo-beta-1,3-glucanase (GH17 family)